MKEVANKRVLSALWWWIAAWRALAGFTLQLALWLVDRSKDRYPLCRMVAA